MMHLLQVHVSAHQYSCPFSVQMVSNPPRAPTTGMSFNMAPSLNLHNDPGSHEVHCLQSVPSADRWSFSAAAETQTESCNRLQSSSPPTAKSCLPLSTTSGPRVTHCHSSENMTTDMWTNPSLLSTSRGFQGGSSGLVPHARHVDSVNRPLSASPNTFSQSQPTLCLQPPSDSDSCLLSSPPTGTSTDSLLAMSPTSYHHHSLPQTTHENICVLMSTPTSHNLIQDTSIFQMEDSHLSLHPVSAPPTTLTSHPLDAELPSEDHEPHLPLGDPSSIEHTSLECLLGNQGSLESRDSESASSRRSSIGVQTQSTEQSWCLDVTD